MDTQEQNSSSDEPIVSLPELKPSVSVKPKRATKPLVEGINSPVSTAAPAVTSNISLTNSEKELISDPNLGKPATAASQSQAKILPEQWHPQGSSSWKKAAVGLFVIVLIVVGVVGGYVWYLTRSGNEDVSIQKYSTTNNSTTNKPTPPTTAVSPSTSPTATATSSPSVIVNQVKITTTPTGFLNVRSTPATSGSLVTKVYPGETYSFTEVKNGWYHITLTDGSTGWVIGTYASKVK
jgi:hypothetical protein